VARTADPTLRDKLLQSARAVFAEYGFAKASMSEIAQRAGVAHGTTYLYFKSKEALAVALSNELNGKFMELALPALANTDLKAGISISVQAFFELCEAERDVIQLLYVSLGISRTQALQAEFGNEDSEITMRYLQVLQERMAKHEIVYYDDLESMFLLITGLFNWVALQAFTGEPVPANALQSLANTLTHMLERLLIP
jgi:AcrR family transcriptional regulator